VEEAEFLGITFRSSDHMQWFQMSMGLAIINFSGLVFRYATRHSSNPFFSKITVLLVILMVGIILSHVMTSGVAVLNALVSVVQHQNPNGPVFSIDCIWFNALMAGTYAIVLYLESKFYAKQNKNTLA